MRRARKGQLGPPWHSYQGLMAGLVHCGHRVVRGWLQIIKCHLDVLLGRKGAVGSMGLGVGHRPRSRPGGDTGVSKSSPI